MNVANRQREVSHFDFLIICEHSQRISELLIVQKCRLFFTSIQEVNLDFF